MKSRDRSGLIIDAADTAEHRFADDQRRFLVSKGISPEHARSIFSCAGPGQVHLAWEYAEALMRLDGDEPREAVADAAYIGLTGAVARGLSKGRTLAALVELGLGWREGSDFPQQLWRQLQDLSDYRFPKVLSGTKEIVKVWRSRRTPFGPAAETTAEESVAV